MRRVERLVVSKHQKGLEPWALRNWYNLRIIRLLDGLPRDTTLEFSADLGPTETEDYVTKVSKYRYQVNMRGEIKRWKPIDPNSDWKGTASDWVDIVDIEYNVMAQLLMTEEE